ncbi:ubiquinone-binding protein [Saccharospirillum sp. MSK14-1]|uniref:type II toxin-antitoxin system RatA family toxin n=1 Tax=Saccharospirillum sp. MSK14-1 TaxID=1897632 RepID=UPI000D3DACF8|nr:type II toxin-antitoxin system RatA family toxin [Saccharospirillum sp. MSK14-1]PTY38102.1 ubiquinone-binding protein [Saccharospirillum sp. MSK14-1]
MTEIHRTALVPHSAETLYNLINDVEAYPQFLDGIVDAQEIEASETHMVGRLVVRKAGIERTLVTRNQLERPHRIELKLVEGPLKSLNGLWTITPLGEEGCKVALDMSFETDGRIMAMAFGPILRQLGDRMVDAFVRRADELYG